MKSKRVSFGYEDTDQKIEVDIYGLVFEINKKNIVDKDLKDLNEDEDTIEREIREVIGKDSIEKINSKRLEDGHEKMTLDVEIAVLTCIYKAYITATSGNMINEIIEKDNVTLLFVTHATGVAKEFCKRGIVMKKGKKICDTDIDGAIEVYNNTLK